MRHGSREQARIYCQKDGRWLEYGSWRSGGQGKRTDLHRVVDQLANGEITLAQLMLEEPNIYCRYRNGIRDIAFQVLKDRIPAFRHVRVIFHTGPTGCGKTRTAMEICAWMISADGLKWWDGYEGQDKVCLDEYSNQIHCTSLLRLCDGYPKRLDVKGYIYYIYYIY